MGKKGRASTPSLMSHSTDALALNCAATCSGVLPSVSTDLLLFRLRGIGGGKGRSVYAECEQR